ncbi:glutathione S-transferase [Epithele typhae]|uniref:glutathione S-transferase n=1 Tax=Epithele typhae TaxID=378194 RepID=UPI002007F31F|nr:glutathione S-transferase [Epithele typhae]KAH9925006.1 glutathione S-transferase [Epithele typhae]
MSKPVPRDAKGAFVRAATSFRKFIQKGGEFPPEKGRYRIYVSYACPWAHRTLIIRKLKGLEDFIGVTVVSPRMGAEGWPFASVDAFPGADIDPHNGSKHVKDLYSRAEPDYGGRNSVPVLWDTKNKTIVNNESSEIIRTLNFEFNDLLPADKATLDFYPESLRKDIDEVNDWVYSTVNNGVYRCGFASTQEAYKDAVTILFASLDRVEKMLTGKDFIVGDTLTEADVRLFVTVIRFDLVYVGHFKCNLRTIRDGYPEIERWMRRLYWTNDAFSSTTNFEHIKTHYYWSHDSLNPTRVVPVGPNPHIRPV